MSNVDEIENEIEYEEGATAEEIIACCYYAITTVDAIDVEILPTKQDKDRVKRIKKKSLRMLDWAVSELYDTVFEDGKEIDNDL